MLVSVIIPAFNCEKSIESTVYSIISSGLTDYEIVIVNDGSTDNTANVCNTLCAKYSFIISNNPHYEEVPHLQL